MDRRSGVLMHISSLWGDYSCGSFGNEALEWIDFLCDCGFSVWQVLPFCVTDEYNSPYKSQGAFSGNPNFVDLPELYRKGLITKKELDGALQRNMYSCEFDRLSAERLNLLEKASERASDTVEINRFMKENPKIAKFCEFMALKKANGGAERIGFTVTEPDHRTEQTWRFIQYEFFTQWKKIREYAEKREVKIIGDLPIYVSDDSADVWADPGQFQLSKDGSPSGVAGVPPDYFSKDGQLWGNPLYDWKKMKSDGFAFWKERMRFVSEMFDGVRIDHFRGFESYFAVPSGETTARNGKWRKGPGMSLIKAISSETKGKIIIAEDLGEITENVKKLVSESGYPGMRVLQFAFLGDENSTHLPHNYENNCVAYTGTHDNNTLLGYVWECDEKTRRKLFAYCGYSGGDWDHCYDSIMRTMIGSHAGLVIFPVQDLLFYGSDTRFNTPGKSDGNWSYRLTREQLKNIDRVKFREWNRMYGRI